MNRINIQNIATVAASLSKKPNKAEVFNMLNEIITGCDDDDDKAALDDYQLGILYAFFLPPVGAVAKTPEQWIHKAVAGKDVRGYLNWAYSDGKRLIGTDGRRLHVVQGEWPVGYYDKAMNPVDDKGRYPDIDRVIPSSKAPRHDMPVGDLNAAPIIEGKPALRVEVIPGTWVNRGYWLDATRGQNVDCLRREDGEGSTVRIDYADGRVAVIMPVRV